MNEESIFAVAMEKGSAAERQAYLDQACSGNAVLRTAVEELLRASADAGSFLEHAPAGLDATVLTERNSRDTVDSGTWTVRLPFLQPCDKPDRIGKLTGKVGEYEIIEVVGQGGMGAVLRAFDTKLSRIVAVKIMAAELAANPTAVKRFLREAQTAAAVHHDHVVTIHAIDDSHRPPYIVMEFIDGQTLQQKIDSEGGLDLKQILRIGSQMAAGLAAAHKHGLIHRDVKPANILLENGVERVKITDFGLARAADDMEMTKTGMIAGTPQYMSPEQAKGEPIDTRSDLFSLGSVLYTMCTGRPAFRAETTMGALRRVCEDIPRPIYEVNAEIPEWLEAIVNKLLAKDPADRFQTAAEVAELLGQHLAHVQNPAIAPRPAAVGAVESATIAPKVASAMQPAIPSQPLWLWGTNLVLMVAVMFVSLLTLVFRIDIRLMAPIGAAVTILWLAAIVYRNHWYRMQVSSLNTVDTKHRGVVNQGVFIQHSVLGAVAIVMLLAAVGLATYMLTAAVFRKARPPAITEGFAPLFNGKDLSGWKTHRHQPGGWTVENGVLVGRSRSGGANHLFTQRGDYQDFHLRADVQIDRTSNSGIYFRSPFELKFVGNTFPPAHEMQICNDDGPTNNDGYKTGSLYPDLPFRDVLVKNEDWFTLDVEARGSHVKVQVNGVTTVDANLAPDAAHKEPRGHFVLQAHKGTVRFRKIEIKELDADVERSRSIAAAADFGLIQGRWAAVSGESNGGQAIPANDLIQMQFVFKGDRVEYRGPPSQSGGEGIFQLDVAANPKRLKVTRAEGTNRLAVMDGIYELSGDRLRICMGAPAEIITEFKTRPGSRIMLAEFVRLEAAPNTVILPALPDSNATSGEQPKSIGETITPGLTWVSLFNGKDLTGWKTLPEQPGTWKVEEGQLVGFGAPSHLFSERGDYQDFHLRVEAQINDGGSSGVYFRVPEFAASRYGQFPDGYEANINSTYATDTDRTGSLTGSLRGVAPFKNSLHKPDEWFTLQVLAQSQRILIQVNGQTTVDFVDANNTFRRGHLALQVWPAQSVVRFRKIEIKELISHEPGDAKNR